MYTITKEFEFAASHQLTTLPIEHPCSRTHGHNYVVRMELKSDNLDKNGFVLDYRKLDGVKQYLDDVLDHQHLNNVLFNIEPTAENIAKHLYDWFKATIPRLSAVEVSETPKTNCRYERN